jgi:hypothetical protein
MSQHDYDIANADGATVRADVNAVLQAIAELNSGATAPSTTFAYMWWADTSSGILKRRNAANTAWISVMSLTTGLIIGTDVQAYNAALANIAGLSLASGDLLYVTGSSPATITRLAKGSNGQFLTLSGGVPAWAAAPAGLTLLDASTFSGDGSVDYDNTLITSTYQSYVIRGWLQPTTDDVELWLRFSDDNLSTLEATNYLWFTHGSISATTLHNTQTSLAAGTSAIPIAGAQSSLQSPGNGANERVNFKIEIDGLNDGSPFAMINWDAVWISANGDLGTAHGGGCYAATGADSLSILFESGIIADGWAGLYGLAAS